MNKACYRENSPQIAQLARHGQDQRCCRPPHRGRRVERVVDEIAHKGCKDPVVGAVPVQVSYRH